VIELNEPQGRNNDAQKEKVVVETKCAILGFDRPFVPVLALSVQSFPLLGNLCGDRILPTWKPICVRGRRSQARIGLDRTVVDGRSTFATKVYPILLDTWCVGGYRWRMAKSLKNGPTSFSRRGRGKRAVSKRAGRSANDTRALVDR